MREEIQDSVATLVRRSGDGDLRALDELIERVSDRIARRAARHVPRDAVPDVVAETLFALVQNVNKLRDVELVEHWIESVTVRRCQDYWRRHYRYRSAVEGYAVALRVANQGEVRVAHDGFGDELENALAQLSPADRMVVTLHYLEDRSVKDVAELMGKSVANVKVRLFRVRKKLRALFESAPKNASE